MIYSMKNASQPILRFEKGEIEDVIQGFYSQNDESRVIFILESKNITYEIDC
jgi:hypothetical protein